MALPTSRLPFTYQDLENFPEDGKRREVVAGELHVSAAPSTRHQRIVGELFFLIRSYLQSDSVVSVYVAPTEVMFDPLDTVQPDLCVLLDNSAAEVGDKRISGAPDWVLEVLSPSSRDYDLNTKRKLYARYGVVYWVIDPVYETITAWDAEGERRFLKGQTVGVSILPGFRLDVSALFEVTA